MAEETKTYVFGSDGMSGANGILSMLAPLMQKSGVDPNVLLALRNNDGFGGSSGSWFLWILVLLVLFRGGYGCGGDCIGSQINNTYGRDLLMQAVNGNGNAIGQLASTLNCSTSQIQSAIGTVMSSVQSVGNSVGLTGQQTINAIQAGNATLAAQLSQCCCDNKLAICQQTNALTGRIDQLANGITQGFSATAYETASQTCSLQNTIKDSGTANTNAILAKLDSMENAAKQSKIDALLEKNAALTAQLSNEHQTANIAAMLSPIQCELNAIKAAQPSTATVPYQPFVAVPNCIAAQMGLYGTGFNYGGNIWS